MPERAYSYDHLFAAMCIIEEMVDPVSPAMPQPWRECWDARSISGLRDLVIQELAAACDAAWNRAYAAYEAADAKARETGGSSPPDPGSFDYEFVPIWLRHCVDWSDPVNPRVRGSAANQPGMVVRECAP